jgi:hypothetical protein
MTYIKERRVYLIRLKYSTIYMFRPLDVRLKRRGELAKHSREAGSLLSFSFFHLHLGFCLCGRAYNLLTGHIILALRLGKAKESNQI